MQVTKPLKRYSQKSRNCRTRERLRVKCICQYFCGIFNISFFIQNLLFLSLADLSFILPEAEPGKA